MLAVAWQARIPASTALFAVGAFWTVYAGWALAEWGLAVRDARRPSAAHGNADEGTRRTFAVAIFVGIGTGLLAPLVVSGATVVHGTAVVAVGLLMASCGVTLRLWAVRTLGRFFRRAVTIEDDHALIMAGPYHVLRHPSYTGSLLAGTGLGIATGNVVSLIGFGVLPFVGILPRIKVEERALGITFGPAWIAYQARTRRVIPWVW